MSVRHEYFISDAPVYDLPPYLAPPYKISSVRSSQHPMSVEINLTVLCAVIQRNVSTHPHKPS